MPDDLRETRILDAMAGYFARQRTRPARPRYGRQRFARRAKVKPVEVEVEAKDYVVSKNLHRQYLQINLP